MSEAEHERVMQAEDQSATIGGPAAAKYLGMHPNTLYNIIAQGTGPRHKRYGNKLAFRKAWLDEWLDS